MGMAASLHRIANGILYTLTDDHGGVLALDLDMDDDTPKTNDIVTAIIRRREGRIAFAEFDQDRTVMVVLKGHQAVHEGNLVRLRIIREAVGYKGPEGALLDILPPVKMGADQRPKPGINWRSPPRWHDALCRIPAGTTVPLTVYDEPLFQSVGRFLREIAPDHHQGPIPSIKPILNTTASPPLAVRDGWDGILTPHVSLEGGGSLLIEEGETLTAIDVNTSDPMGRTLLPLKDTRSISAFNGHALPQIVHHIQLRQLAGPIMIDFVRMARAEERPFLERARIAFKHDDHTQPLGWSRGGFFELTRRRGRLSLPRLYGALLAQNPSSHGPKTP